MSATAAFCGNNYGLVRNCTNNAYIESVNREFAAGICGGTNIGTIDNCNNNGTIVCSRAFGICGDGNSASGVTSNCTNTGTILSKYEAAGISYHNNGGIIIHCVNTGFINSEFGGTFGVGGICAMIDHAESLITQCINAGVIEAPSGTIGTIVGLWQNNSPITDCYYDIQKCKYKAVNNQPHAGVTPLPTHLLIDELLK
jgi:hypothetical protein